MGDLDSITEEIEAELDEKDEVREIALKSSRAVIRLCGRATRLMHSGGDFETCVNEAGEELEKLLGITHGFPDILHSGIVESAMQEFVEVRVLNAYLRTGSTTDLPGPGDLSVTPEAYILGMGDVIGEIRRLALDNIRGGNAPEAARHLEQMEEIYDFLMRFNYPSGLVAIRRKQDIARGVLEKTRGDVTMAMRSHALERKLGGLEV